MCGREGGARKHRQKNEFGKSREAIPESGRVIRLVFFFVVVVPALPRPIGVEVEPPQALAASMQNQSLLRRGRIRLKKRKRKRKTCPDPDPDPDPTPRERRSDSQAGQGGPEVALCAPSAASQPEDIHMVLVSLVLLLLHLLLHHHQGRGVVRGTTNTAVRRRRSL
jgi:hypothetical protein